MKKQRKKIGSGTNRRHNMEDGSEYLKIGSGGGVAVYMGGVQCCDVNGRGLLVEENED